MRVAVIGASEVAWTFVANCLGGGLSVVLEDLMPERLRKAQAAMVDLLANGGDGIELAMTVEDAVRDADVVVDFVPDELESKLEIWSLIDRMAPPKTIMCTPSDVLSITDLASCTYRADRCVMMRTPDGGTVLRLLTAKQTSAETVATVTMMLDRAGYGVAVEADPDLPMLLKNMNAATLV